MFYLTKTPALIAGIICGFPVTQPSQRIPQKLRSYSELVYGELYVNVAQSNAPGTACMLPPVATADRSIRLISF